jgi:hypothetical protein
MPEQIILLVSFLLVVLLNLLLSVLNRRRERGAATQAPSVPPLAPRAAYPPTPADVTPPRVEPISRTAPPMRRRPRRIAWQPGDVRHAIVVMTVFGPPRALADEGRDLPGVTSRA